MQQTITKPNIVELLSENCTKLLNKIGLSARTTFQAPEFLQFPEIRRRREERV